MCSSPAEDAGASPRRRPSSKASSKVLLAERDSLEHRLAEPTAALIVSLAGHLRCAVSPPATTTGKNVMPRVAALLDVMQVSDITKVVAPDTFERPIYAGNAIQTVKSTDAEERSASPCSRSRPSSRPARAAAATGRGSQRRHHPRPVQIDVRRRRSFAKSERPDLTEATIIVSGGRAMGNADNFKVLHELADVRSAPPSAPPAPPSTPAMPSTQHAGRPDRQDRQPDLYIAAASPARSSIWPA